MTKYLVKVCWKRPDGSGMANPQTTLEPQPDKALAERVALNYQADRLVARAWVEETEDPHEA